MSPKSVAAAKGFHTCDTSVLPRVQQKSCTGWGWAGGTFGDLKLSQEQVEEIFTVQWGEFPYLLSHMAKLKPQVSRDLGKREMILYAEEGLHYGLYAILFM